MKIYILCKKCKHYEENHEVCDIFLIPPNDNYEKCVYYNDKKPEKSEKEEKLVN